MSEVIIYPETTKNPISLIGHRAGVCYGSDVSDPAKNYKRGINCIKSRHGRVLEFVDVHMNLKGFSAKVIREWYTHIGGAPTRLQKSTRYIEYKDFQYITPDTIKNNIDALTLYEATMATIRQSVEILETVCKIPKEDSSMLLPLGMCTSIVDHRNARNLIDMSRNRECSRAFHEYRDLFFQVKKALSEYSSEWKELIDMTFYPKCVELGYCPEADSCGRCSKKDAVSRIELCED